jgi:hypothetical protein
MKAVRDLKRLVQLPLVMVANQLTWHGLSKEEKDELLTDMFVIIVSEENPVLSKEMEIIYDWCLKNYESKEDKT